MSCHTGQRSSQLDMHSKKLKLGLLKQQNKHVLKDVEPFKIAQLQSADDENQLLKTALQLK